MTERSNSAYTDTVVGRVNRHRLVALFVCVPAALVSLRLWSPDPVTPAETLLTIVFFVAAYAGGAASVRVWPSARRRERAVAPPPKAQIWFQRALSILCALLSLLAALGAWAMIRHA
jgi:TRAP-type C4-dicarboxylate transport system permease small subunit